MKKMCWLIAAACLLTCLLVPAQAAGSRIILYTEYRQTGWGDLVQVGWVDEDGGVWRLEGSDAALRWPAAWEDQLAFLDGCAKEKIGELKWEDLFALKGLIESAEPGEGKARGWMNDAGTETSRAVRLGADGREEMILLGVTGDDLYENTDPNAQALYRKLRELFPEIRCYAGMADGWGFRPVPLRVFLGRENVSLRNARVTVWNQDCEAGLLETDMTPEDQAEALALIQYGWVTGKENASSVTGNTYVFSFDDAAGKTLCSFSLYHGLLTWRDGMYRVEMRPPVLTDREALTVRIGQKEYRLGESTAQDLIADGWRWEQEDDGVFGFSDPEENGWFYVRTEGDVPEGVMLSVNLLWADGVPCAYGGAEEALRDWLEKTLGGAADEDGLMTAYAFLSDGRAVRIAAKDVRPVLTLIR